MRGLLSGFNPHPREAGDATTWPTKMATPCFNPHPREAGDSPYVGIGGIAIGFNPHPREAGDSLYARGRSSRCVSIHTRVKRVTESLPAEPQAQVVSIHTRVKRVTAAGVGAPGRSMFQSTPA